jgi:hypothetical protein
VTDTGVASPRHQARHRGRNVQFRIGDKVRDGAHVGTVTDVGTVLIQVKTTIGTSRMACPWELVRVRASHDGLNSSLGAESRERSR